MKKLLIIGVFALLAIDSFAQENYAYLAWNYQYPLSNREWLEDGSTRGGAIGYKVFLNSNRRISIGGELNWTTFSQYAPTETFYHSNGATTTDYFKYVNSYGIVLSTQYYFPLGEKEMFFPYVGLGLGANRNTYTLYYNIYTDQYNAWGFLGRPEAGIVIRFSEGRSLGAIAAVHYDYSTNKNSEFGYKNFSSAGFKIGLVLMSH
jgi:hypothetical protein